MEGSNYLLDLGIELGDDVDKVGELVQMKREDPEKAEEAFKREQEIISIAREAGRKICELGKRLIAFRDQKLWFYLGHDSFAEWYHGVGLSKTTVYRSIRIYELFVLKLGKAEEEVYDKDIKKLDRISVLENVKGENGKPVLNKDTVDEWLTNCGALAEPDLISKINEARGVRSKKEILQEDHGIVGTYVLVKTTVDVDEYEKLAESVNVSIFKSKEGDLVAKI